MDYSYGEEALADGGTAEYNRFALTRGYFTVKRKASDWLSMRLTMDIHQQDDGDYSRREKYYYVELKPPAWGFLTDMRSEIGMGHMPWLDFEEHLNPYRCQGTMAIERAGIFNSSDLGVSLRGYLGGRLADARRAVGSTHYDGRWGSWHLGVYNGAGYHAREQNENKALEGRLTVRPLPDAVPGLQLSYLGILAKGNQESIAGGYPDYDVHLGMLSYERPELIATVQAFTTDGNAKGSYVVPEELPDAGKALRTRGLSAFANWRPPVLDGRWNLFGRWDRFDVDRDDLIADETAYDMVIGGTAWEIHPGNLVLLAVESTSFERDAALKGKVPSPAGGGPGLQDDWKAQAVYQIKF